MIDSQALLNWYDENARALPWRVPPLQSKSGAMPDPYHIWLSEIMLQQTTVAAVKRYFLNFREKWPDVHSLAAANDAEVMGEWAGLGYYARARNLLKCARIVSAKQGGEFPKTQPELQQLPGVGPYTSAAIAAIAFQQPATVVDANVERVISRVFAVQEPLPDSKKALYKLAEQSTPSNRAGDFAQAMMDLGATICTQNPTCDICPIADGCNGLKVGLTAELPRKRPKPKKPTRHGIAYFVRNVDGAVLLETRAEKGLLGGMLALPTTDWTETEAVNCPPIDANWIVANRRVKHTFTHFHLELSIWSATIDRDTPAKRGRFIPSETFLVSDLPTVMRKAFEVGDLSASSKTT